MSGSSVPSLSNQQSTLQQTSSGVSGTSVFTFGNYGSGIDTKTLVVIAVATYFILKVVK